MGSKYKKAHRSTHARIHAPVALKDEGYLQDLLGLEEPLFFLALDQVQDPHNLGACIRTAEAAGCHALVIPKNRTSPISEVVRHVACGAAEKLPIIQVTNLARSLAAMKEAFVTIIGTGDEESQPLYQLDLTESVAMVMGAEGEGLRRLTSEQCDQLVTIPMLGETPCLNVSVATGICLFEVVRQRMASHS
ncbi:MAG: 23S rRNA (guanosine(2251)-2'-O)-methyltransferase RlmB [Candidatus Methylacidiphilales bacterium]